MISGCLAAPNKQVIIKIRPTAVDFPFSISAGIADFVLDNPANNYVEDGTVHKKIDYILNNEISRLDDIVHFSMRPQQVLSCALISGITMYRCANYVRRSRLSPSGRLKKVSIRM